MSSLESFDRKYETETKDVVIRGRRFSVLVPRTLDRFVDPHDIFNNFALWSKLWEASIVLADYLAGTTTDPQKRFLEIGCGLGLVGVVASSFGHEVTMTEYNPDTLNFARANAQKNAPEGGPIWISRSWTGTGHGWRDRLIILLDLRFFTVKGIMDPSWIYSRST